MFDRTVHLPRLLFLSSGDSRGAFSSPSLSKLCRALPQSASQAHSASLGGYSGAVVAAEGASDFAGAAGVGLAAVSSASLSEELSSSSSTTFLEALPAFASSI